MAGLPLLMEKKRLVLFKCGKAQDSYSTNNDIITHATSSMDILDKHYPNEEHVLVFDNTRKTLSLLAKCQNSHQNSVATGEWKSIRLMKMENLFMAPMGRFSKSRSICEIQS
jgi:hypothetical protein